ncbi:MAG: hypothetical protein JWM87_82 [Candidatus Eremiobacteraeota bacterium]|nr:hypothetical protein [Candidatus Eremiobacteraeota bacterium]
MRRPAVYVCAVVRAGTDARCNSDELSHRAIVDDAPGVTRLTYTRPQATPVAADVTGAITAYCGPAQ